MKTLSLPPLLALLAIVPAVAQSPFDGTWRINNSKTPPRTKPDVYLLQDGIYHCQTCDPPIDVKADGRDHMFNGDPCYDAVKVEVVDERTVKETDQRNGKTVGTSRIIVSADGNTATLEATESCNAKGDLITWTIIMTRVGKGPAGSHAISGSWQESKIVSMSDNALEVTLKLDGKTFSFIDPTGQGFTAKLDGTEAPFKGDLGNTVVSVKQIDKNTLEQTNKRAGRVVAVWRWTVAPDGKTLTAVLANKVTGAVDEMVLEKQ